MPTNSNNVSHTKILLVTMALLQLATITNLFGEEAEEAGKRQLSKLSASLVYSGRVRAGYYISLNNPNAYFVCINTRSFDTKTGFIELTNSAGRSTKNG